MRKMTFWALVALVALSPGALSGTKERSFKEALALTKKFPEPEARLSYLAEMGEKNRLDVDTLLSVSYHDPSQAVRVDALRRLAEMKPSTKLDRTLTERLFDGGSLAERQKLAELFLAREKLLEVISERAERISDNDPLATTLALEGVGYSPLPEARRALVEIFKNSLADAQESAQTLERILPRLREGNAVMKLQMRADSSRLIAAESLRAYLTNARQDPEARHDILKQITSTAGTSYELLMLAMEALMESEADPAEVMAMVNPCKESVHEPLGIAAKAVSDQMQYRIDLAAWEASSEQMESEGYARPYGNEKPKAPPPRIPKDQVYVIDCTGSMFMDLQKLREQIQERIMGWVKDGFDVRVGVILYRDNLFTSGPWVLSVLPMTHDLDRAFRFLESAQGAKANDRAAAVSLGLEQAFNRMNWRSGNNVQRRICLIADTPIDQPESALAMANFHAASIRVDVWFMTHGKTRLDLDEYARLVQAGGGEMLCSKYELADSSAGRGGPRRPGDQETTLSLVEYEAWKSSLLEKR